MDKIKKVQRGQAVIEARAAQDREAVRQVLKQLSETTAGTLFEVIEERKHSSSAFEKMIYTLADIGLSQILSEWEALDELL